MQEPAVKKAADKPAGVGFELLSWLSGKEAPPKGISTMPLKPFLCRVTYWNSRSQFRTPKDIKESADDAESLKWLRNEKTATT